MASVTGFDPAQSGQQPTYTEAHRIPVEEEKPPAAQGRFVHPELFASGDAKHRTSRPAASVEAVLPDRIRPAAAQLLAEFTATGAQPSPDLTDVLAQIRDWLAHRTSAGRARLWWPRRKP